MFIIDSKSKQIGGKIKERFGLITLSMRQVCAADDKSKIVQTWSKNVKIYMRNTIKYYMSSTDMPSVGFYFVK